LKLLLSRNRRAPTAASWAGRITVPEPFSLTNSMNMDSVHRRKCMYEMEAAKLQKELDEELHLGYSFKGNFLERLEIFILMKHSRGGSSLRYCHTKVTIICILYKYPVVSHVSKFGDPTSSSNFGTCDTTQLIELTWKEFLLLHTIFVSMLLFALAKAVPAHVHIPLYEQLQEEQRNRSEHVRHMTKDYLSSISKPFGFEAREKAKIILRRHSYAGGDTIRAGPQFKARPLPDFYYQTQQENEQ
jgi:hypothetical protein